MAAVTALLLALAAALSIASLATGAVGGFTTYRGRTVTVNNPFLASLLGGGDSVTLGGDAPPTRVGYARVVRAGAADGSTPPTAAATSALAPACGGLGGWTAFALAASAAAGAVLAALVAVAGARGRPAAVAGCVAAPILVASAIAFHVVNVKTLAGGLRPVDAAGGLATVSATQSPGPALRLAVAAAVAWALAAISAAGLPPREDGEVDKAGVEAVTV